MAEGSKGGKAIHGIFAAEVNKKGCDRVATSAWLTSGNFQAETEGLIVAAQDGVLPTASYRHSVLRDGCNPTCRECGTATKTTGHILSACPGYLWNLYKCRHDAILNILVGAVAERLGVRLPRNRWEKDGTIMSAVYEGNGVVIMVDQCLPTRDHLSARRPDLVVRRVSTRTICIMEVACTWEPLVEAREAQKRSKYRELAADLAHQWPQFTVTNLPVVIGTLGLIRGVRNVLLGACLWNQAEIRVITQAMQTSGLNGSVRVLRRHFAVHREDGCRRRPQSN